jgi:hypothetical protein
MSSSMCNGEEDVRGTKEVPEIQCQGAMYVEYIIYFELVYRTVVHQNYDRTASLSLINILYDHTHHW